MCAYSIDLGIHPDAKGGRAGTVEDPYPLQIALTQGTLVPEQGNGPYTGFTPVALASFNQLKAGDIVIFRVFETSLTCRTQKCSLQGVIGLEVTFQDLDGKSAPKPWDRDEAVPFSTISTFQRSLAFTSVQGGMELPCFFQKVDSEPTRGLFTYTVRLPDPAAQNPVPCLFKVVVGATIAEPCKSSGTFYYQDDPEMVIGPDEDPRCGDEDRSLDQFAGIAATSR